MKILIYSDCFIFGGSENVIESLLKSHLLSTNYNLVFYYAYNKRYAATVNTKFPGYKNVHAVPVSSSYNKWGYDAQLKQHSSFKNIYIKTRYLASAAIEKSGLYNTINFSTLYKVFKKEIPDILYINNGGYPGAESCRTAVLSAAKAGIKNIVFNVNNLALPQKGAVDKALDKKINTIVSRFITASVAAREALITKRHFTPGKCITIANTLLRSAEEESVFIQPLLRNEFNVADDELVIGSTGLLTKRKGFDFLIEAIKFLKPLTSTRFKVFIFGEGEERTALENKINEYNLDRTIFLPGFKKNVAAYVKDFDIYVCSSIANEDFPYSILEAMLLSKPIIGTNVAGIPEQVKDGYNGFIIPASNAEALADKIKTLLSRQYLIKSMGPNSLVRYKENFSNDRIIRSYYQLFDAFSKNQLN